ncbi:GntR family transcriptional regulator [Primorskyibacter flagellatus]|uniref:DNA-binding transcriptional regulator, GntR family n=1 Tax=Primorskyibacter flagellatus TaxID=1387277 RepID=A0A1W2EJU0_9RHOB|nr:GntR family transcriptional regulator [Primorskyibacter flagellatus]SMD09934.1 DNA-binding transcriptional regulator, GntR family [Primorskyibacter flagellatus]
MQSRKIIIPAPSLSDQAFAAISDGIAKGELEPGARLKEAELARDFGISRGPLREAMNRLESHGLVERRTNLGVFITALTLADLDDLFTMREALEGQACGLAATRMAADDLRILAQMLARHESETASTGHYKQVSSDNDFHFFIIKHSGSQRLFRALCDELYLQIRMYRHRSSSKPGRSEAALAEHADIVRALETGERYKAEEAMRLHISNARENLLWTEMPAR